MQSSDVTDRNAKMLDETVRRVVMSVPDRTVDVDVLRSELAKAMGNGATTLFHLFKIGRDVATRPAEPTLQRPELVDRRWFKDRVTGALFELGWHMDGRSDFIQAVDKANRPAQPSAQQIADMCRSAEKMRRSL